MESENVGEMESLQSVAIAEDPYSFIEYGNLDDELTLLSQTKCISYIPQLVTLLGENCREEECTGHLKNVQSHTNCGYAVKLTWECDQGSIKY